MEEETKPDNQQLNIGLSHSMRLPTAVAIGSSVTVGMSVYLLIGLIYRDSGAQAPTNYLLTLFFLLPVVLALAERSSVTPGQGGLFNLSRSAGSVALAFSTGWIAVGGLLGLATLFAWEGGLALSQLLSLLFEIEIEGRWLSGLLILLVSLRFLSPETDRWKRRTVFVYAAIFILGVLFYAAWLGPMATPSNWVYLPSSTFFSAVPFLAICLWGLHFVLDRRDEIQRPRRQMLPALLLPVILGGLAGALAAVTLLRYPSMTVSDSLALVTLAQRLNPLLALITMLVMLGFGILGVNESLSSSMKLTAAMSDDGFLPKRLKTGTRIWQRPIYPLLIFVLIALLFAFFLSVEELTSLSAITIILASALVNVQDLFRFHPRLPDNRRPKLPFHPLVPGVAVALSITVIFTQPLSSWLIVFPWLLLGALVYVAYARQGAVGVRQQEVLVSGIVLPVKKTKFRVMVALADPAKAASLIRLGAQIAAAHNGPLLVLQVSPTAQSDLPNKQQAQSAWQELNDKIRPIEMNQVPVTPLVRLAPSATEGILTTIWEEKIDLVLLGWPAAQSAEVAERDGAIGQIVHKAQCEVVILHGQWTGAAAKILVPVVSAGHSPAALSLGQDLRERENGESGIVALQVLPGKFKETQRHEAEAQLERSLAALPDRLGIVGRVVGARSTQEGILQIVDQYDVVIVGLSEAGFMAQTDFSGLPVAVAEAAAPPTLLVKRKEKTAQYWLRRSWDELSGILPTLTPKRQAVVRSEMRQDAKADIDFYVLMVLAASIALFGLLQNSAAVIIGAMLVAPLMSPILAMAHSIVRGQQKMLRTAADSAVNGIVLAITVAALLSLFLLVIGIPLRPTDEILARTQPNFLDLLVALASGAAAAYAISRSEVGAALPGVAIAAALVPPLAVVGYGLGTAQFDFAAGAMLLFLTNLAAIVLAASVIFLLLGFRPPIAPDRDEQARYGLKLAIISLILISIPLLATSRFSTNQLERDATIGTILESNWPPNQAQVTDIVVSRQRFDDLFVSCTIYDHAGVVTDEAIAKLQVDISHAVDEPVTLGARTINAQLHQFNDAGAERLLTVTATPTVTETQVSTPAIQDEPTKSLPAVATERPSPTGTQDPAPGETPTPNVTPGPTLTETIEPAGTETVTVAPEDTVQPEATATWTSVPLDTAEPGVPETETPAVIDTAQPGATVTFTPLPLATAAP